MLQKIPKTVFLIPLLVVSMLVVPSVADDCTAVKDHKKPLSVSIIGIGMVAGGTAISVLQYTRAKEVHSVYRKSAFTDNTKKLRAEVRRHDTYSVLGAVLASLGAVTLVVDF